MPMEKYEVEYRNLVKKYSHDRLPPPITSAVSEYYNGRTCGTELDTIVENNDENDDSTQLEIGAYLHIDLFEDILSVG